MVISSWSLTLIIVWFLLLLFSCSLVVQLCSPMDCSMPGFPLLPCLLKFAQTHLLSWWCCPTISSSVTSFSSCPQCFPASGSFLMSQLFASGGQNTGTSASVSVLPMNIQGQCPLELSGLISLQSKGLSRVSSSSPFNPQFKSINSSVPNFLYSPTLISIHDYWKNHNSD